jgi:hypothetical protein
MFPTRRDLNPLLHKAQASIILKTLLNLAAPWFYTMSCLIEGHRVVNRCHLTDEIEHEPKLEMSLLKNLHTLHTGAYVYPRHHSRFRRNPPVMPPSIAPPMAGTITIVSPRSASPASACPASSCPPFNRYVRPSFTREFIFHFPVAENERRPGGGEYVHASMVCTYVGACGS